MATFKIPTITTFAETSPAVKAGGALSQDGYGKLSSGINDVSKFLRDYAVKKKAADDEIAKENGDSDFDKLSAEVHAEAQAQAEAEFGGKAALNAAEGKPSAGAQGAGGANGEAAAQVAQNAAGDTAVSAAQGEGAGAGGRGGDSPHRPRAEGEAEEGEAEGVSPADVSDEDALDRSLARDEAIRRRAQELYVAKMREWKDKFLSGFVGGTYREFEKRYEKKITEGSLKLRDAIRAGEVARTKKKIEEILQRGAAAGRYDKMEAFCTRLLEKKICTQEEVDGYRKEILSRKAYSQLESMALNDPRAIIDDKDMSAPQWQFVDKSQQIELRGKAQETFYKNRQGAYTQILKESLRGIECVDWNSIEYANQFNETEKVAMREQNMRMLFAQKDKYEWLPESLKDGTSASPLCELITAFIGHTPKDSEREQNIDEFKIAIEANGDLNAVQKEALIAIAESRLSPKHISNTVRYCSLVDYAAQRTFRGKNEMSPDEFRRQERQFVEIIIGMHSEWENNPNKSVVEIKNSIDQSFLVESGKKKI